MSGTVLLYDFAVQYNGDKLELLYVWLCNTGFPYYTIGLSSSKSNFFPL